jgi:hypothetical protein
MHDKLRNYDPENPDHVLLNMDETHWLVCQPPRRAIAMRGAEIIPCDFSGDKKAGFTAVATITAHNQKLPIVIIAKGKSADCMNKFLPEERRDFRICYTQKGWTTADFMIQYLNFLKFQFPEKKLFLLMDQYPAHFHPSVKRQAETNNITLIPIPKGGTSKFQPLDRSIFGSLNTRGAHRWASKFLNRAKAVTKAEAVELLLECWDMITPEEIVKAWDIPPN